MEAQIQQMLMQQMMGGQQMRRETPEECAVALTPSVEKRVRYLRNLQHEQAKIQAEFRKAYHSMEVAWASKFTALFEKRAAVVAGTYEPTEEESKWDFDEEEVDEEGKPIEKPAIAAKEDTPVTGIPNFWLAALMRDQGVQSIIEEHDFPVLAHLQDVKCELLDGDVKGFRLHFHFGKNEYFTNDVLSKTFSFSFEVEEGCQMFDFETVSGAAGTVINWNEDKSTCETKIKKKQRKKGGKGAGKTRTIFKTVPQRSFFHMFDEGDWEEDEEEEGGEDGGAEPVADGIMFGEAATQIKEEVIPNALLFAMGENEEYGEEFDDDYDGEDEDYDEDDEDAPAIEEINEDDEDEEEEEEEKPRGKGGKPQGKGGKRGGAPSGAAPASGDKPPECKQS